MVPIDFVLYTRFVCTHVSITNLYWHGSANLYWHARKSFPTSRRLYSLRNIDICQIIAHACSIIGEVITEIRLTIFQHINVKDEMCTFFDLCG